jgi:hypothetical protein
MLNEQLDLDSPYNPNPFNDPNLEKATNAQDHEARKEKYEANGRLRPITKAKRKTILLRIQTTILNRGYVPLVLRLISWIFSIAAIFLAGFITKYSILAGIETRPSTVMAFVVNTIALFYLPLIAKVETTF